MARKGTGKAAVVDVAEVLLTPEQVEAYRATLPEYRRYEQFVLLGRQYDVVRGCALAHHAVESERTTVEVAPLARTYGLHANLDIDLDALLKQTQSGERIHVPVSLVTIDPVAALSEDADLTRPILLGVEQIGTQKYRVALDGFHRIYKAYHTGVTLLPCYVLTSKAVAWIRTA